MLKIKTRQDKTASILIVIAVILAFGLIGCSNGGGGSSSSSSSSGWKAVDGETTTGTRSESNSIYTVTGLDLFDESFTLTKNTNGGNNGEWTGTYSSDAYPMKVTVSGNSWESEINFGYGFEKTAKGTFTFSGNNFTLKVTHLFE